MSIFPNGWALQKPTQTIEPAEFERMWRSGQLIPTLKRDGNRAHIITAGDETRIYSRSGTLDWTDRLPHIQSAFAAALPGWLIDVELHTQEEGTYSFQNAMNGDTSGIVASIFDMFKLNASDIMMPYEARYANVKRFAAQHSNFPMGDGGVHIDIDPNASYEDVLAVIEEHKIEGIVFWDRNAGHALNLNGNTKRGRSWKVKIRQTEDLIVTGWNPNKGDPALGAGSLELKRVDENGRLVKAGKVGSFDKQFDRHEAMARVGQYVVEVSHYGVDENGNMVFPKIERYRDDLLADFGMLQKTA